MYGIMVKTIKSTSCGYVNVEAAILETDEATTTSLALSASMVVLSDIYSCNQQECKIFVAVVKSRVKRESLPRLARYILIVS